MLKFLCSNSKFLGSFRTEFLDGKTYRVAPAVILVEGVLNGKFYPKEEIEKFPESWNGRPVLVDHRYTEDGTPVSCNKPEFYDKDIVGKLFNTMYDDGKLKTEIWVCEEKVLAVKPDLLSKLSEDSQLEVSTGLWGDETPTLGIWEGTPYSAVYVNYRPDHLALLPDSVGACSWEDGCGIRVNSQEGGGDLETNLMDKARKPKCNGTETDSWADVPRTLDALVKAYYKSTGEDEPDADSIPKSVSDLTQSMKNWISSLSLLGNPDAESFRDLFFFPVVNPNTGKLNEGALKAVISGRGSSANIDASLLESAQEMARKLLKDEFDMEANSSTSINEEVGFLQKFKSMLNSFFHSNKMVEPSFQTISSRLDDWVSYYLASKTPLAEDGKNEIDPRPWGYVRDVFQDYFIFFVDERGGRKFFQASYSVDPDTGAVSVGNDLKEVLEKIEYVEVKTPIIPNSEVNEVRKEKISVMVSNGKFEESDRTWLQALEDSTFDKIWAMSKPVKVETPPASNTAAPVVDPPPAAAPVVNEPDAEEKEALEHGKRLFRARKKRLIEGIMANKRNKFSLETLEKKPMDELETLSELAGIDIDFSVNAPAPRVEGPKPNERNADGSGVPIVPNMKWKRLDNGQFVADYSS